MNRYWFRPRRYGMGATPSTWEGWTLVVGASALLIGSIVLMEATVGRSDFVAWMAWAVIVAAVLWWLVRVCRYRTDGEWRWRWGEEAK